MASYLSAADFVATSFGRGVAVADAEVYCAEANAVVESMVNVDMLTEVADAGTRCRAAALIVANWAKQNFASHQSASIGGKLSVSFATNKELRDRVKSALGILAEGDGPGISCGEMERAEDDDE